MEFSNLTAKLVMEINEAIEKNVSDQIINDTTKFPNEILHMSEELKPVIDYLLLILLVLIMLSMGCEISLSQLWNHIRRPVGLSIGIVSQFGIKPLAAFAVLLAFGVEGLHATGVLIISCCPGGVLSNTFTYFSDGDLPLR
ncbi:UNVERIFIED_CONTAM: Solute carrier family 10 member 6 [Trichonephila clavipes]